MKILLQDRHTLQYLRTVDSWTKNESEAYNFLHSQKAIDFAHDHDLVDVYVTVKFLGDDPEFSVPLPIKPEFATSRARLY
jgi:hypothetical protein